MHFDKTDWIALPPERILNCCRSKYKTVLSPAWKFCCGILWVWGRRIGCLVPKGMLAWSKRPSTLTKPSLSKKGAIFLNGLDTRAFSLTREIKWWNEDSWAFLLNMSREVCISEQEKPSVFNLENWLRQLGMERLREYLI